MPSYEYECQTCGNRVSFVMSIHKIDQFDKVCQQFKERNPDIFVGDGDSIPEAGLAICGGPLTQVYDSPPASHFKGRGWTPKFGPR